MDEGGGGDGQRGRGEGGGGGVESIADEEANGRGRSLAKITPHARTRPHTVGVSVTEFSCMRGRSSGKTGPPFSTGQARRRAGGL